MCVYLNSLLGDITPATLQLITNASLRIPFVYY